MNRKNLWIFNQYAVPRTMAGGTRHHDLARKLQTKNYEVTIFAGSFQHSTHEETRTYGLQKHAVEIVDGVRYVWLQVPRYEKNDYRRIRNMLVGGWRLYSTGKAISILESGAGKPDIIIGSSPHLFSPLAALMVAMKYGARFVLEVRDLWPESIVGLGLLSRRNPVTLGLAVLERILCKFANRIVVVPPGATDYYSKMVSPRKIVRIPNGVDLDEFPVAPIERQNKSLVVMYAGAHSPANGLEVVLDAAKKVQESGASGVDIVLVGSGSEKARLQRRAEEMKLANVKFFDPVTKKEVPRLLSTADVLLHIEKNIIGVQQFGGSPNKVYDYLAAARPLIIASSFISDEIKNAGGCVVVPSDDPSKLAEAVLTLKQMSADQRFKMGQSCRKYVEEHCDTELLADKLDRLVLSEVD